MGGKVRVLRCTSCGAGLKEIKPDDINVRCEYCGQMVRVAPDDESYYVENILAHINMLGGRVRNDTFDDDYEHAKRLIEAHSYAEADIILNGILKKDVTQARAWFYKALLPIVENESVTFRGHTVNIQSVEFLSKRVEINQYLTECGLGFFVRCAFMKHYATGGFLHDQRMRFINEAIQHGSTHERREFFKQCRKEFVKHWENKVIRRNLVHIAFAALLLCAALAVIVVALHTVSSLLDITKNWLSR